MGRAFDRAARHRFAAVDRRALSRRGLPPGRTARGIASNPIWKMSISGCAAPLHGITGRYVPEAQCACHRGERRRWAGGIRRRCAGLRAINFCWRPATIPPRYVWPVLVAQFLWGARGAASWTRACVGCGASGRDFAVSRPRVRKLTQRDPELLEQILRANEAIHPQSTSQDIVLEAVFPAHRWGKVTHERHRNYYRHL